LARLHDKPEQGVRIILIRLSSKADAGGGDGQHAQQVGKADVAMTEVNYHPEIRSEVTMKGAVPLQPLDDGRKRFGGPENAIRLLEEILQLRDLTRMTRRYLFDL
jgi:hypothetical protein